MMGFVATASKSLTVALSQVNEFTALRDFKRTLALTSTTMNKKLRKSYP